MDIFHVFLRTDNIKYIFCTQYISCLPKILKDNCNLLIQKVNKQSLKPIDQNKRIQPLIQVIIEQNMDYSLIRDHLYEILTYNLNIHYLFTEIILGLYKLNYFQEHNIINIMDDLATIIKKYNNNYRSIFHLECFVIYLIKLKT